MSARLHTFRAANSQSALAAVKAALGPEAILVSTRTLPGGLWRKAEIEVVAAVGEAYEPAAAPVAARSYASAANAGASWTANANSNSNWNANANANWNATPTPTPTPRPIDD